MSERSIHLWSDEPSLVDLLAFGAVAETAVEAVLDDVLDPIALGISGPWGSGKSTVLKLIEGELAGRSAVSDDQYILVVPTDPWRYDPVVGAKATLILEVLRSLEQELERRGGVSEAAESKLKLLAKRVNWVKALKVAARTSITLQLPGIDDLSSLINEGEADDPEPRNLDEFRQDFAELLADDALSHVRRVVVLVDDLDRCLPETVVDTLETMRLFLAVPKMSFVIAADEDRVADALRERYPKDSSGEGEEPARLYLHKIVQTTLKLPALSRFDTEAFLLLLLLQNRPEQELDESQFNQILENCTELRTESGSLDSLVAPDGVGIASELQFAARLTPMLYEKLQGSPRRVKRFLNDLYVRSSIASRRGIELEIAIVAKLMILELLLPDEFARMLKWLAQGELRARLTDLEDTARTPAPSEQTDSGTDDDATEPNSEDDVTAQVDGDKGGPFSDSIVRWAKLPPSLDGIDLSPYLHLAASFGGAPLIDTGLPERLRDVAANLLSSSRASQKSVADDDIKALTPTDGESLIEHLGRMARDRPGDQLAAVGGILRVSKHSANSAAASKALGAIPAKDVKAPSVLLFSDEDSAEFKVVLEQWLQGTDAQPVKNAVAAKLKAAGSA